MFVGLARGRIRHAEDYARGLLFPSICQHVFNISPKLLLSSLGCFKLNFKKPRTTIVIDVRESLGINVQVRAFFYIFTTEKKSGKQMHLRYAPSRADRQHVLDLMYSSPRPRCKHLKIY